MTDEQLKRALRSIGFACFAVNSEILLDDGVSIETAAERLHRAAPGWTLAGCRIRVKNARQIMKADRIADAMRIIAGSRIDREFADRARNWNRHDTRYSC